MNAQTQHTPGPWQVGFSDGTGQTYITAGDHPARKDVNGIVVVVGGCEDSFGVLQGVRNPADARLIAAAPDLYEALKEALNQLDTHQMEHREHWSNEKTNMMSAARVKARAALAKADAS